MSSPARRGLVVYTRQGNQEGDWILITRRNWAITEIFGTEEAAREWAYEPERWLNTSRSSDRLRVW